MYDLAIFSMVFVLLVMAAYLNYLSRMVYDLRLGVNGWQNREQSYNRMAETISQLIEENRAKGDAIEDLKNKLDRWPSQRFVVKPEIKSDESNSGPA